MARGRHRWTTAIVTGGTGGLGAAVVARLLDDGWRVVVPWVAEHELERVQERERLELVQADLFEPRRSRSGRAWPSARPTRRFAALVNLVGGFAAGGRVHETPIDEFERQFRLNLRPTYLMTQAALPALLEHGGGVDRLRGHPRGGLSRSPGRPATSPRRPR